MNSAAFLRAETLFPAAQRAGRKVAVVTAKEKLGHLRPRTDPGEGIAFPRSARARPFRPLTVWATWSPRRAHSPIYSGEASILCAPSGRTPPGGRPGRFSLSFHDRLHAAQVWTGGAGSPRLLWSRRRRTGSPPRCQCRSGIDRRPWDECKATPQRIAERHLPGNGTDRTLRIRFSCDPSHH